MGLPFCSNSPKSDLITLWQKRAARCWCLNVKQMQGGGAGRIRDINLPRPLHQGSCGICPNLAHQLGYLTRQDHLYLSNNHCLFEFCLSNLMRRHCMQQNSMSNSHRLMPVVPAAQFTFTLGDLTKSSSRFCLTPMIQICTK